MRLTEKVADTRHMRMVYQQCKRYGRYFQSVQTLSLHDEDEWAFMSKRTEDDCEALAHDPVVLVPNKELHRALSILTMAYNLAAFYNLIISRNPQLDLSSQSNQDSKLCGNMAIWCDLVLTQRHPELIVTR